jgi:hypothetical protein
MRQSGSQSTEAAAASVLTHPLFEYAGPLEPLVILGDGVYAKTRAADGPVTLVTSMLVAHPMRQLASLRTWDEHGRRTVRQVFPQALAVEVARRQADASDRLLAHFLTVLAPRFALREWRDDYVMAAERLALSTATPEPPSLDCIDTGEDLGVPALAG